MRTLTYIALSLVILLTGCSTISNTLSNDRGDGYDFRKTRWGDSRQRVLLAEKDSQIHHRSEDTLIYKYEIAGIPTYLIYTFKNNKLRAAGYITEKPAKNAQNMTKMCMDKHGKPTERLNEGMIWKTPDTVIYTHAYPSHITLKNTKFERTSDGLLSDVMHNYAKLKSRAIDRWDAVWSYVDAEFYEEQQKEKEFRSEDLSLYEKVLIGIMKRNESIHFTNNVGLSRSISQEQFKIFGNTTDK